MRRILEIAIVLMMTGMAAPAGAADPPPAPRGTIVLRRCVLEFERSTLLGSATTGAIQEVLVKPGQAVKAGQVLGRLFDADLRAEVMQRTCEAENNIEIRLGEPKLAQARHRRKASDLLSKRNMISAEELEMHRLEAQSAELEVEAARHRRHLAELARDQVEAMLQCREFVSPHDGIVGAVLKSKGESVTLNEPVFRVIGPDTIRVSGYLDVGDAWNVRAGQEVRVTPEIPGVELPIEEQVFIGCVEYVDPEVSRGTRPARSSRSSRTATSCSAPGSRRGWKSCTAPAGRDVSRRRPRRSIPRVHPALIRRRSPWPFGIPAALTDACRTVPMSSNWSPEVGIRSMKTMHSSALATLDHRPRTSRRSWRC